MELGRIRHLHEKGDPAEALSRIRAMDYSGCFEGLVGGYQVRLLMLNRKPDEALGLVRSTRALIQEKGRPLRYSDYCEAYCDYLECVLTGQAYDAAGTLVNSKASSPLVRSILRVV
jgi:hypothetical protein